MHFQLILVPSSCFFESANRKITLAGILILRKNTERAALLLEMARRQDCQHPILNGNLHRRTAELHLVDGKPDLARQHADRALDFYRSAGERIAECSTLRLLGDIEAICGKPEDSASYYQKSLEIQAAICDLNGIQRTLKHLALRVQDQDPKAKDELKGIADRIRLLQSSAIELMD